jgi:hypothetical protein
MGIASWRYCEWLQYNSTSYVFKLSESKGRCSRACLPFGSCSEKVMDAVMETHACRLHSHIKPHHTIVTTTSLPFICFFFVASEILTVLIK